MADHMYSKPYFVTYFNTSFFILPMIAALIRKARRHPEEFQDLKFSLKAWTRRRYSSTKRRETDEHVSGSMSEERLLSEPLVSSQDFSTRSHHSKPDLRTQLTFRQTARLSLEFCILWFLANYFVVAALEHTTVASGTILTSTSSVFTLIFGALSGVEKFTLRKLLGVLASLAGIILVSSVDLSGGSADDEHRGQFPSKSFREIAVGDVLALCSAVMYGVYAIFMKKRIADESLVNMPTFFGFVGLFNLLLLWPGLVLLHFTWIERFELPSGRRVVWTLLFMASFNTISDLAWAYAVLLTSPLVITVGLSLSIPLSLVGQMVLHSQTSTVLYWIGAIIVVLSFIVVNHEDKAGETQSEHESSTRQRLNGSTATSDN